LRIPMKSVAYSNFKTARYFNRNLPVAPTGHFIKFNDFNVCPQ
jgi:hypothetical protein